MTDYEVVVGLECHVELSTATKMFCGCPNTFGAPPNTLVCEVCLGHPGTLPVANRTAIEHTMLIGLALDCSIAERSLFHRKNYFYPDMPKNFQISQYDLPLCVGGALELEVDGQTRRVGIHRVHLEEDTGKTTHAGATGRIAGADYALEDYNRAGVPLVEIVSEPDMRSAEEARAYLQELRLTLETLGVSDVRMEEGSLRCDANVSVRPRGSEPLGTKVEIKNLNSVRSLHRAVQFEADRQIRALEGGERLVQETRHWDETAGHTSTLRSKEEAFDYRYFPEPDLQPIEPDPAWIGEVPTVRERVRPRAIHRPCPDGGARVVGVLRGRRRPRRRAPRGGQLDHRRPRRSAERGEGGHRHVEGHAAPSRGPGPAGRGRHDLDGGGQAGPRRGLRERRRRGRGRGAPGLRQVSDEGALGAVVEQVIADNPGPVEQFRGGKEGVIGFLVGQVMKASGGSANPKEAQRLLRDRLTAG